MRFRGGTLKKPQMIKKIIQFLIKNSVFDEKTFTYYSINN